MELVTNSSTTIQKSNQLSTGKIMSSLSLNQAQLFAYAILVTQKDGLATFDKVDFERQFDLQKYNSSYAKDDATALFSIDVMTYESEERWTLEHVFRRMSYDNGTFTFEWEENFRQYIIDLKERYTRIDLSIASKFKSSFTWTLYEYLLAKYGYYSLDFSRDELMQFFGVADRPGYISNTNNFKTRVLDVAIAEINEHTELKVSYNQLKKGRSISGFRLYFSRGKQVKGATAKQTEYTLDLIAKLKEDYIFRIIEIDDAEQSRKANDLIMTTLRSVRSVDFNKLTHVRADELIKHLNSIIKLLDKMIIDDKDNAVNKDKYAHFEIPLYDWADDQTYG